MKETPDGRVGLRPFVASLGDRGGLSMAWLRERDVIIQGRVLLEHPEKQTHIISSNQRKTASDSDLITARMKVQHICYSAVDGLMNIKIALVQ